MSGHILLLVSQRNNRSIAISGSGYFQTCPILNREQQYHNIERVPSHLKSLNSKQCSKQAGDFFSIVVSLPLSLGIIILSGIEAEAQAEEESISPGGYGMGGRDGIENRGGDRVVCVRTTVKGVGGIF